MNVARKIFLLRRRWDRHVVTLGAAGLPFRSGITSFAAIIFACIGIYLVAARHRSARLVTHWFVCFAVAYALWSLALIAVRGEAFFGNRQVTYSIMIGVLAFVANGMVLVRDPLRHFVIGARIGIVAIAVVATFADGSRFGMGGNPAPFSMVAAIGMIGAILHIREAPRWAPNSLLYILVGSIPIFASQTRAVLVIVPVVLLVEGAIWLHRYPPKLRLAGYGTALVAVALAASFGPVNSMINERFVPIYHYYGGDKTAWQDSATGDLRLSMWEGGVRAVAESPLAGHGAERMARVVDLAPTLNAELKEFGHVHNILLDEMLNHGFVGLILLGGLIGLGFAHVLRHADNSALQRNAVYVFLVLMAYGMLHNPLLHETTIAALFFYLGVLIAHITRRTMAERSQLALQSLSKK